jgi:glutamate-1-semialdehyde 2,1-aminomutase
MNDAANKTSLAIEASYRRRTPKSAELSEQARKYLPSGVVHDSRYIKPYGLYSSHAMGSKKWDVDGNEYIDYFGGHGSLMLGHNHPEVVAAATVQLGRGTHFATNHELEIRWAEKICEMVPSAEKVRFHASGTEATQMAVRLARAFTGKNKLIRFHGHYHGWSDDMTSGYATHFDGSAVIGVPESTTVNSIAVDPYDESCLDNLDVDRNDIAAVIVEPFGAATGKVPIDIEFLKSLRNWTSDNNVVLIFDEVVTGFRASPGGVQACTGIIPDITALAKIVAGGLPGGAVAGSGEIMNCLDHAASNALNREKVIHPGTFNACPVTAATGIQTLNIIQQSDACARANKMAQQLRKGLNQILKAQRLSWLVYGEASAFHIYMGGDMPIQDSTEFSPGKFAKEFARKIGRQGLYKQPPDATRLLKLAMNINGVDLAGWPGGLVSAAHSDADIETTIEAFSRSLELLRPILES